MWFSSAIPPPTYKLYFRGKPHVQLWEIYPVLEPFYTEYEKTFDPHLVLDYMAARPVIPTMAVVCYLIFCFAAPKVMSKRDAFDLKGPLAAWNLFLAVFSLYGCLRTVPHLLHFLVSKSFEETVCDEPAAQWGAGSTGLAVMLFILSKFPELVDTVFVVLRKKPLIFLHWYHHFTALTYCWHAYVSESGAGLYFAAMNYTVHALMYFYYFLMAVKRVPKWFPVWVITMMQIGQMIVGCVVVGFSTYYRVYGGTIYAEPGSCAVTKTNLMIALPMYGSYLALFVRFALERYVFGPMRKKAKAKAKAA